MSGYTENNIVILRDFNTVFDLSNDIELWPQLFTEYKSAKLLSQDGNEIKFQLTTFPEDDRPSRTWTSKRIILKDKKMAIAERIEPTFPFEYMKIKWLYEELPKKVGVIMTWIQEFNVHPECKFTNAEMEGFLNKNTRSQMRSVKDNIEHWEFTKICRNYTVTV